MIGLARANSLWPLPFATSCCGIEFMATMGSNYDLARFGSERMSFSPRQADVLFVAGTIAKKLGPVLKQVYLQMAEPRWVIAIGACASSGGIFDTYSVLQGIDKVIPVDVYVPGCPPRPEQIIDGIMKVQELAKNESTPADEIPRNTKHCSPHTVYNKIMAAITNEFLLERLQGQFGEKIKAAEETFGMLSVVIEPSSILDIVKWLNTDNILKFKFLTDICGSHYPDLTGQELCAVYHVQSMENNVRLQTESLYACHQIQKFLHVTSLYSSANWMERETYDFYGIIFIGHPNLKTDIECR